MEIAKAHVVFLAYHGQGHINPMVQFSKRLAAEGIHVTVATTLSNTKVMKSPSSSILFESIYDDCTEGGVAGPAGFKGFFDRFEASGSRNLSRLIRNSERPVKCLVYDANISWASRVASEVGVAWAAFFTQSCAAIASYYPMHCELSGEAPSVPAFSISGLPNIGEIGLLNMASLGPGTGRYPPIIRIILQQFDNSKDADWVLFNSFDKLEEEVVNWMSKLWPVRTIGPTVPSAYLDNRVEDDNAYGFNIHNPSTDTCLKWLESKEARTVIYVSFGSNASPSTEQTAEIAEALSNSNHSFLWVVKPSEESKLPPDFSHENSGKGLIVKWCPQLVVLAHSAVGCFVSHCGWNSTMEAISLGMPIVAMPQFLDQMTNAHFVEHIWQVGIAPKADEKSFIKSDEIKRCIDEIMQGEKAEEIRKNALHWKALAKEAIDEGGSSDNNIDGIISHLVGM